jgi:hypothetical protein
VLGLLEHGDAWPTPLRGLFDEAPRPRAAACREEEGCRWPVVRLVLAAMFVALDIFGALTRRRR